MSELSAQVLAICRRNYKDNCGGCELRPKCVAKIGYGSDGLAKWVAELNARGEQVECD